MTILNFIASSNFITLNKTLIKMYGLEEAVLLGELASEFDYWTKKEQLENGWFYSTVENIEENTGINDYKQRKTLKHLEELGLIQIKIKGIPAKRYIKINEEQLLKAFNFKFFKNLRTGTEKNKELDVEILKGNNNIINNNKNKNNTDVAKIIKFYQENIGLISPTSAELLFSYLDDMEVDLIIEAIKIASIANVRNARYINGILKDWNNKGYKTMLDLENERNKKENTKPKQETEEEKKLRRMKEMEEILKND